MPQNDSLFPQFTVRETIVFASRIKNQSLSSHGQKTDQVISELNLNQCSNLKISKCSGGQIKRVSIAIELVSDPNILILDEPTSGLDSSNAESCIKLLTQLADWKNTAIVVTIHQPNHLIFSMFHKIYLLSKSGQNIFFGPPNQSTDFFAQFELNQGTFPSAEYAIEVASGERLLKENTSKIHETMACHQKESNERLQMTYESELASKLVSIPMKKALKQGNHTNCSSFISLWLLFNRSFQVQTFKSPQLVIRIILNLIIGVSAASIYATKPGVENGCWLSNEQSLLDFNTTDPDERNRVFQSLSAVKESKEMFLDRMNLINGNISLMFSICVFILLAYSIGTVLFIPIEIRTAVREIRNKWYSIGTYFMAKTLADIPSLVISVMCYVLPVLEISEQPPEFFRFMLVIMISIMIGWVCESMGTMTGIVLIQDLVAATSATMALCFPMIMFSGFLVKIDQMSFLFKPMTYISWVRHGFEAILISIYGFDRCIPSSLSDLVQEVKRKKENSFDLLTTLWKSLNISPKDSAIIGTMIEVDNHCVESVLNGTEAYLGIGSEYKNVLGDDDDQRINSNQPSYVLSYFSLDESDLYRALGYLVFIGIFLRILAVILLHYKIKKSK